MIRETRNELCDFYPRAIKYLNVFMFQTFLPIFVEQRTKRL